MISEHVKSDSVPLSNSASIITEIRICELWKEKFPELPEVIEYLILLEPSGYILYYRYGRLYSIEALCISVKPNTTT
jgi:hypothetical protein